MTTNQEIINKAAMSLSDLAAGGQLNTQQADKFIQMLIDEPTILKECRTVPMKGDSRKLEKIGFGQRILQPGVEGTALAEDKKAVPTTSTVTLNAKEVIAQIDITYDSLENNIEGKNMKNTIMQMLASRAALDIEELIVNGDTGSADPYLALIDGVRKQATTNVLDHASAAVDKGMFKSAYKLMPTVYKRTPGNMRFYVSPNNETEWVDVWATRTTAAGDKSLASGLVPKAYGVPVRGIAMLEAYDNGVGTDVSDAIFTHPKNIICGISRKISIEVDKDITARKFIIVLTMKLDAKFEEEKAVVKTVKILE